MRTKKGSASDQGGWHAAREQSRSPMVECFETAQTKVYDVDETLFAQGEPAKGIFLIRSGNVKVWIGSSQGKQSILRIGKAGDVLGLHSALSSASYHASAQMLDAGSVSFMSQREFARYMNESESFSSALMRTVGHQFGQLVSHVRLLLSGSVKEKLAKLIVQWANDFGEETSEGTRIPNLLTHEEIAQIIGASRETVTRLLSTLRRKQIVKTNNGSLWILNWAALNSSARQF